MVESLESLPNEILVHILSFLEAKFVIKVVSRACKRLRDLIGDDSLWKIRTNKRFKYPPVDPTVRLKWGNICAQQEEFCTQLGSENENRFRAELKGHYASVDALLLVPVNEDHQLLISGSRDRAVALWNPKSLLTDAQQSCLLQKHLTAHSGWVWHLSSNGLKEVISAGWDNKAVLWDLGESEMTLKGSVNCRAAALCSSFVNREVAVGSFDRKVRVFDLKSGGEKPVEIYNHHRMPVLSVLMPRNHAHFLLTASEDGHVTCIDRRIRKLVSKIKFERGYPISMDVVDGDNCLYVGDKSGGLHLIDATNGKLKEVKVSSDLHKDKIVGVNATRGGIVTASTDKTVKVLTPDLEMKAFNTFYDNESGEITSVSYSHGILAMGDSREVISVYRCKDGSLE